MKIEENREWPSHLNEVKYEIGKKKILKQKNKTKQKKRMGKKRR